MAHGKTYFAIQTKKQEITELEYSRLTEDEKRLYTRILVNNKNKYLFKTAREAGVENLIITDIKDFTMEKQLKK